MEGTVSRSVKMRRILLLGGAALLTAFTIYVFFAYQNLEEVFLKPDQFVPTRIYSDVARVAPPMSRRSLLRRLNSLHYEVRDENNAVRFKLRAPNYPVFLIPENHPTLSLEGAEIELRFDSTTENAALVSVSANGEELSEIFLEPEPIATLSRESDGEKSHIREVMKFSEIPAPIWKAIIAVEDQHFLEHSGFDPRGLARAIFVNLKSLRFAQGGSTLTQQLVKNLMARRNKNPIKKLAELFLAIILEMRFGKEVILERYLNEVYLGQVGNMEVHGVAEGAKHFFGKKLEELNLAEIAMMAGLIRGPHYYSPYRQLDRALERQRWVLKRMAETGQIAHEEAKIAEEQPLRLAPPANSSNRAPYFTDFVKAELIRLLKDRLSELEIVAAGFRVYTTLDSQMNAIAQQAVTSGVNQLQLDLKMEAPLRLEGALASVDPVTGFIRALVGGRNYAESNFNRILNMRRQVGSTFKPFVYLAALDQGADENGVPFGPAYPIEDSPWTLTYDRGKQTWSPKNYEKEYRGWISMREALAHSVNTSTARLGAMVGPKRMIEVARHVGIESELPAVPSLSLGVAELTPVELLRSYATLANHGLRDEITVIRGITEDNGAAYARFIYRPEKMIEPGHADVLTEMLQEIFETGTARFAKTAWGFDRPAAGKTGTTSQYRDAWFAGYTPQLATVVWVGLDQYEAGTDLSTSPKKLTGAGAALPIWVRYMKEALADQEALPFAPSQDIKALRIDRHTGQLASDSCPDEQVALDFYPVIRMPDDETCAPEFPVGVGKTQTDKF